MTSEESLQEARGALKRMQEQLSSLFKRTVEPARRDLWKEGRAQMARARMVIVQKHRRAITATLDGFVLTRTGEWPELEVCETLELALQRFNSVPMQLGGRTLEQRYGV